VNPVREAIRVDEVALHHGLLSIRKEAGLPRGNLRAPRVRCDRVDAPGRRRRPPPGSTGLRRRGGGKFSDDAVSIGCCRRRSVFTGSSALSRSPSDRPEHAVTPTRALLTARLSPRPRFCGDADRGTDPTHPLRQRHQPGEAATPPRPRNHTPTILTAAGQRTVATRPTPSRKVRQIQFQRAPS
jgi:hypothetical protein